MQVAQQAAQSVGHLLFATHGGQRRHPHVQAAGGLVDGVGQQGVRCQFGEHPETVLERGLHRRGESHGVAQIFNPVVGVAMRQIARVEVGGRVIRNLRLPGLEVDQHLGQLVEDRVDLRGVGRDVDGDLAGHDFALLPRLDQFANGFGCATDDRGLRRGHHGHHDILDAACHQLGKHLLRGQFHRCHGARTGDAKHQP